jgi:rhodanese-related sulfurtransferase
MTASCLKQMGWRDVAVLVSGPADGDRVAGRHVPRVLGLEGSAAPGIAAADLRDRLAAGEVVAVDLELSRRHAHGHVPGSWFAIRSRLREGLAKLPANRRIVLTSSDGALARLAADELRKVASVPVLALTGGTQAWVQAGLPLETGMTRSIDQADDVFLSPRDRGQNREDAMREYLTWEINLVRDMALDDDHRFRVVAD